jgi:hypothetical protein
MSGSGWNKGKGEAIKWLRERVSHPDAKCLIWPFYRMPNGYGQLGLDGKMRYAHRVMCELVHGAPPTPKHEAAHRCGNGHQGCVNPKHLAWKTKNENRKESTQHGKGGRNHYGNKGALRPDDIAKIWELKDKMRQTEIAAQFGVSWQVISGIYCGRHYKRYAPTQGF